MSSRSNRTATPKDANLPIADRSWSRTLGLGLILPLPRRTLGPDAELPAEGACESAFELSHPIAHVLGRFGRP